jgi:sec-independent protein translocase protein TatC
MIGGLIVAFPYIFFELWRFIKPALSPKEKRYGRGAIFWVSICFFCRSRLWVLFIGTLHL